MQRVSRVLSLRHALCRGHSLQLARLRNFKSGLCITWVLGVAFGSLISMSPISSVVGGDFENFVDFDGYGIDGSSLLLFVVFKPAFGNDNGLAGFSYCYDFPN